MAARPVHGEAGCIQHGPTAAVGEAGGTIPKTPFGLVARCCFCPAVEESSCRSVLRRQQTRDRSSDKSHHYNSSSNIKLTTTTRENGRLGSMSTTTLGWF